MWGIMAWPLLFAPINFCAYSIVRHRKIQALGFRGSTIGAVSAAIWTGMALAFAAIVALGLLIAGEHPLFALGVMLMAAVSAAAIPLSALAGYVSHKIARLD